MAVSTKNCERPTGPFSVSRDAETNDPVVVGHVVQARPFAERGVPVVSTGRARHPPGSPGATRGSVWGRRRRCTLLEREGDGTAWPRW